MTSDNTTVADPWAELLSRAASEAHLMRPLIPTYIHLIVSAVFPIFIAAHASLTRPPSAATPPKRKGKRKDDADDEEVSQKIENLSPSDALIFPLLAGCTLASLYLIIKWLQDPAWLNWALGIYFSQLGFFFAFKFLKDALTVGRSFLFPMQYSARGQLWIADNGKAAYESTSPVDIRSSPLPGVLHYLPMPSFVSSALWCLRGGVYTRAELTLHIHRLLSLSFPVLPLIDACSLLLAAAITLYHTFVSKPWPLTNFLGFSFCYGSLQFISPTTAWTGTLILSALFFYDIYFVFYTPMMVTVATSLDVPIKLLFPRPDGCVEPVGSPPDSPEWEAFRQCLAKKRTMAMLGLGDIVIPGILMALALRFDLFLFYLRKQSKKKVSRKDLKDSTETAQSLKAPYTAATGSWGERFHTSSSLRSERLKAKSFPKPYFCATALGYVVGLIVTVMVMQVFQHAQPALLYLVPGVLISLWGTALLRGELRILWEYTEEEEDESEKKKDSDKQRAESKNGKMTEANGTAEKVPDATLNKTTDDWSEDEKTDDKEKKSKKADPEDKCRRLFYLAITLPDSDSDEEKRKSRKSNSNVSGARLDRSTNSDEEVEVPDADHQPAYNLRNRRNTNSDVDSSVAVLRMDGQPVVKRRRKV